MVLSKPSGMNFSHSVLTVTVCPLSQSSLQLDLDSCSAQLHCIALLDAGPHLLPKTVLGVGKGECGAKNLPGLVPHDPGSPLTQKVVPLVTM
jgi:hypothetical protein